MQTAIKQNGKNKTLGFVLLGLCAFYFICALGIFVLPFDVLARSSLARDFVEAMLKIYPAVERAFTHTDFTQKAAFYIAYMGVVKVFVFICVIAGVFLDKASRKDALKQTEEEKKTKRLPDLIFAIFMVLCYVQLNYVGYEIGYYVPEVGPGYHWTITLPSELFWQMIYDFFGLVFAAICAIFVAVEILVFFRRDKSSQI